jgi:hypothetical protein
VIQRRRTGTLQVWHTFSKCRSGAIDSASLSRRSGTPTRDGLGGVEAQFLLLVPCPAGSSGRSLQRCRRSRALFACGVRT